jgi:hypothetical protein
MGPHGFITESQQISIIKNVEHRLLLSLYWY